MEDGVILKNSKSIRMDKKNGSTSTPPNVDQVTHFNAKEKQRKKAQRKRRNLKKKEKAADRDSSSVFSSRTIRKDPPDLIATDHKQDVTSNDALLNKNGNPSKSSMHACGEIDAEAKDAAAVKVSSSKKNRKNRIRRQKQRQAAAKAAQLAKEAAIEAELEANVAPYRALLLDFMPESHANAILRPLITNKHLTDDFKSTQRPWSDESKDRWPSVQTALQQFLSEEQVGRLKLIFMPLTLVIEVVRYILEQGNCTEEVMYSRLEIVQILGGMAQFLGR